MTCPSVALAVSHAPRTAVKRLRVPRLTGLRGFTLVELMVTVAIIGILVAAAAPSFNSMITRRQINDQTSAFTRSLTLARTEAIKRQRVVAMCRSADPQAATPTCSSNTEDWSTGWVIFEDQNGNRSIDGGDTIVRIQPGWRNSGTIKSNTDNALLFRPNGLSTSLLQTITFTPKASSNSGLTKKVVLNFVGRWNIE